VLKLFSLYHFSALVANSMELRSLARSLLFTVLLVRRVYAFYPGLIRCHGSAGNLRETYAVHQSEERVAEATQILSEWDRMYNAEKLFTSGGTAPAAESEILRSKLPDAIRTLNDRATNERLADSTKGRCMLGICAASANEGVAALKSWVTSLELPRGLLHGMDKDGIPLELNGGVYIKYNSGGVYTFADIRKSKMGFDALWKPGDAMLEEYDGAYRGVYFQVELADGEFRQFLVPLDVFES
jgi:Domain of unknown function (DUF1824)